MSSGESKRVDLDAREGVLELGRTEGEEPIIRMCYMRKKIYFSIEGKIFIIYHKTCKY